MLIAHERFQRNVRTHVHSFYFVAMPPSKRKMNGKSNVEQAGHVKAARARQAPAASSSASAGHELDGSTEATTTGAAVAAASMPSTSNLSTSSAASASAGAAASWRTRQTSAMADAGDVSGSCFDQTIADVKYSSHT
tara:strand:- start:104 stop:514 length:411 start_codon:yes stop_codon:yes gene_type:complete